MTVICVPTCRHSYWSNRKYGWSIVMLTVEVLSNYARAHSNTELWSKTAVITAQTLTHNGSVCAGFHGTCYKPTVTKGDLVVLTWTVEEASPPHSATPSRRGCYNTLQCNVLARTSASAGDSQHILWSYCDQQRFSIACIFDSFTSLRLSITVDINIVAIDHWLLSFLPVFWHRYTATRTPISINIPFYMKFK